jgi:ABC-2 type transport system permease protein
MVASVLSLFRIESIKIFKRRAYWVAMALLLVIVLPLLWTIFGRGGEMVIGKATRLSIALPTGWGIFLDLGGLDFASLAAVFVPVLVTIFAGSEFIFKTSRQNIIDGLSREQFFIAKLVAMLILAASIFVTYVVLVTTFGYILVDKSTITQPIIRTADLQMIAGFVMLLLGYGLIATLFAITMRNTGTALGLFFFYSTVIEQLIPQLLRMKESLKPIADACAYLPLHIFKEVVKPGRYDDEYIMNKMQSMMGQTPTFTPPTNEVWLWAAGYIVLFATATYIVVKKTDL